MSDPVTGLGLARADLRDGAVLFRTNVRAQVRRLFGNTRRLIAIAIAGLLFGVGFPLSLAGPLSEFGGTLAGGSPPVGSVGATALAIAFTGGYLGAASAFQSNSPGSAEAFVRTAIPPAAAALGRAWTELFQAAALFVPVAIVSLTIVGFGAGGPLAPVLLGFALLVPLLVGMLWGRLIGAGAKYVYQRLGLSTWVKVVLIVVATGVIFVGTQQLMTGLVAGDEAGIVVPVLLPGAPLQAYAGVALAPLGADAAATGIAVLAVLVAAVPLGLAVTVRIEAGLTLVGEGADEAGATGGAGGAATSRGVPRPFDRTPAARIGWRYLLRTVRDPTTLSHLFVLVFGAFGFLASTITDPETALTMGPGAAVVGGVALAGAAYCPNPLGDDREQLPLLLTGLRDPAVLARARAVAGIAIGLALVGLSVPLGLVRGTVVHVLARTVLGVVLLAAGTGVALGMGALVPSYDASEYMNVERVHPSMLVVLLYSFGSMLFGVVGLLLVAVTLDGDRSPLVLAGWGVYLLVVIVSGVGGYAIAANRLRALTLDDV